MAGWIVLVTLLANVGGTGLGGLLGVLLRRASKRGTAALLSFTGGIMLAVVCFDLVGGALRPAGAEIPAAPLLVCAGILGGYAAVGLLDALTERLTAARGNRLLRSGALLAAAMALHNFPEGVVIGAGYATDPGSLVTAGPGFLLAVLIGVHDVPEGMAVAAPLAAGGMGRVRAVLVTAATGLPTVAGALLGWGLGGVGPLVLSLALSFASGAMLYMVLEEMLPAGTRLHPEGGGALPALAGLLAGLLLIGH